MTKKYKKLVKTGPSSTVDEQKMFEKKETQKLGRENKKTTSGDSFRQSSQKLIQKLRKITLHSISTKQEQEEQKTNDVFINVSEDITITPQSLPEESNEKPKLKGILKNSSTNLSSSDSINESHFDVSHLTDNIKMNKDNNHIDSTINSSKTVKQVRFNDKISKKRYRLTKSVSSITKLSNNREQKQMKKLERRADSLNLPSKNLLHFNFTDSSEFPVFTSYDSSGDESSDNDK